MTEEPETIRAKIISAALQIAEVGDWRSATLSDISEAADVPLEDIRRQFADKQAILAAYIADVDHEVLAADLGFEAEDTPRDRLFELLMNRFEVLGRHRSAVGELMRAMLGDPVSVMRLSPAVLSGTGSILDAAGISANGPFGCLRAKGLLAVWLATLRVWLEDDSPDLSRTMAVLDRHLRKAEQAAIELNRFAPTRRAQA